MSPRSRIKMEPRKRRRRSPIRRWFIVIASPFFVWVIFSYVRIVVLSHPSAIPSKAISFHHDGVENKRQRVVLLMGPHKTSSTSIQTNIVRWVNMGDVLPGWCWPAPEIDDKGYCEGSAMKDRPKIFYPYVDTLHGRGQSLCLPEMYKESGFSGQDLIDDYEGGFRNAWREGKSLIIATESMDYIASDKRKKGVALLDRILHGMPFNSKKGVSNTQLAGNKDDITVVVNFRTPRVEHLISLWHECCMDDMTPHEFLQKYVYEKLDKLRSLDTLHLVEILLKKGLNVILIDMAGVSKQGYDISNVVACDVLGADCTSKKTIAGDTLSPSIMNKKSHSHNMTNDELAGMEMIIRNYDCKFQSIVDNAKLTILYPDELMRIFDNCKNIAVSDRIMTRNDLKIRLGNAAGGYGKGVK